MLMHKSWTTEKWFNNSGTTYDLFQGNQMKKKNSYSVLLCIFQKVMLNVYVNFLDHVCDKHIQVQWNAYIC